LLSTSKVLTFNGFKQISDIVIGDLVLSSTGKWQKVLDTQRKKADAEAVKLTIKYCPPVEMAAYHPVLGIQSKGQHRTLRDAIRFGFVNPKEKLTWIDANLLQEGDLVACPKVKVSSTGIVDFYIPEPFKNRLCNKSGGQVPVAERNSQTITVSNRDVVYDMPAFLPMTNSMFEFMGWYAAEGHTNSDNATNHHMSVVLTLSNDELEVAKKLKNFLVSELNIPEHKISIQPHNGSLRLVINNTVLAEFLAKYFKSGAENKDIPNWLLGAEDSLVLSFLRGWVKGDGTIQKVTSTRTAFSASTVSQDLAYKGHLLFNKVGIPVWFREKVQDLDYINKHSKIQMKSVAPVCYSLGVSGSSINKLFPGLYNHAKSETMYFEDDQYFYFPVTDVEVFNTSKDFCCVTTEDHTINVPFTTHNCRIFFNLEPYIQQITVMHSLYPFSKFDMVVADPSIKKFYEEMSSNGNFNLFEFILQASLSREKFGEAICFGNLTQDETANKSGKKLWRWSNFILLEPELVEIKTDMLSGKKTFEMVPTEEIKALVSSTRPEDQERVEELKESSPELVNAVLEHRNIKLDEECVSQIARITDPSATRGTSRIQSCFKALILQDWIRLAQSAYAKNYVFPKELWTIGDLASNTMPSQTDLDNWKQLINSSIQSPPFTIIAPPIVHYEPLSVMGKQFPLNAEYDYIQDQLLVGLGVNKNIILGEGPNFGNSKTMALQALVMQYKAVRDKFEDWMINKFFRPIAEKNEFYTVDPDTGEKQLILPQISWYKSLDIDAQEREQEQFAEFHKEGLISTKTLFSKYPNLDYETERKQLEEERGTIFDKGSKDNRLPAKISRPSGEGMGGGGGGDMGGGIGEPQEPVEPGEPSEEGAEGLPEAATEGTTEVGETNVGGTSDLGAPEV